MRGRHRARERPPSGLEDELSVAELSAVEARVEAVGGEELLVGAGLDDRAAGCADRLGVTRLGLAGRTRDAGPRGRAMNG